MAQQLVVKCTHGLEAPERANLALNVAAAGVAAGAQVSLWLSGEATWLAVPGRAGDLVLEHAAPAEDLLAGVLAAGQVTVCSQCAARRELTESDLLPGVRIAGVAAFLAEAMGEGTTALVY